MHDTAVVAGYHRLLTSIGDRAPDIGERPVVTHWPHVGSAADLPEQPRPLLRAGRAGGRTWVVGWHPNGASHRGYGPAAYTDIIVNAVRAAEGDKV